MPRARKDGWADKLSRAIVLREGTKLVTLHEARAFIIALPENRHSAQWDAAIARLMAAAESGSADDIGRATRASELAFLYEGKLNVHATEELSDPSGRLV